MRTHRKATAWAFGAAMLVSGLTGCGPVEGEFALTGALLEEGARYEPHATSGPGRLPELKRDATLPDYLAYAAIRNPGLEAAFHRWRAAIERIPQAGAFPDPRLTFGWFIREVETKVGPQRAKVGFMQPLPGPGKRSARAEMALREAEAARARYGSAKLSLFHRVERAYWEYWYLSRAIQVTEENLQLLGQLEGVARRKYAAGTAESSALTKVQVELGKLEDRFRERRDLRAPMSARLSAALGRPSLRLLPWPSEPPEADAAESGVTFDTLMEILKAESPEIARARLESLRALAAVTLARRRRRPDFAVGLDYIFTGEAPGGMADSGKDPVVLGFSMSLPLARAKYRAAEREAVAMQSAAERSVEDRINELGSALQLTLFRYRDAGRKIELYRDALVPKARQALEVARKAFEAGRVSFLDLIDAQRTLLEFELSHARARADRAIALAEIEMLVGREIADGEQEGRSP